jgi:hypothetical protein
MPILFWVNTLAFTFLPKPIIISSKRAPPKFKHRIFGCNPISETVTAEIALTFVGQ